MSRAKKFIGNAESLTALQDTLHTQDIENTKNTLDTKNTQDTKGAKDTQHTAPKKKYRINLSLPHELGVYLNNVSWTKRTSITKYLTELIEKDKEQYLKNGGDTRGWIDDYE